MLFVIFVQIPICDICIYMYISLYVYIHIDIGSIIINIKSDLVPPLFQKRLFES